MPRRTCDAGIEIHHPALVAFEDARERGVSHFVVPVTLRATGADIDGNAPAIAGIAVAQLPFDGRTDLGHARVALNRQRSRPFDGPRAACRRRLDQALPG